VPINGSIGISLANMKLQFMWLALFLGCLVIGVLGTISEPESREIIYRSEPFTSAYPKPSQTHTSLGIKREQIPEQQKESSTSKREESLLKKLVKSIGVVVLTFACTMVAIALIGNERIFITIAGFEILVSLGAIWKSKK